MANVSRVDRLLAESERLREELRKMATRLELFSDGLLIEVQSLRAEAEPPAFERSDDVPDPGVGEHD